MYVCICQEVTDRQIRQAVEEGASTMRHLRKDLGVAACCGRCAPHAKALLDEFRQECRAACMSAACA
jgi:bacterioferritin-associated ferredoxin